MMDEVASVYAAQHVRTQREILKEMKKNNAIMGLLVGAYVTVQICEIETADAVRKGRAVPNHGSVVKTLEKALAVVEKMFDDQPKENG